MSNITLCISSRESSSRGSVIITRSRWRNQSTFSRARTLSIITARIKTFQDWLWDTSSREGLASATTPRCSNREIIRMAAVDLNTAVWASLCRRRPASIGSLRRYQLRDLDYLLALIQWPMKTWHTLRPLISSTSKLWGIIKTSARISNNSQITGICRASLPCSISQMRRCLVSTISKLPQTIHPHNGLFHMQSLQLGKIWRKSQIETRQGRLILRSMTEEQVSNCQKLSC